MIKCGIIGFGKMGKIRLNSIIKSGRAQVISVYDPNNSDNIKDLENIKIYDSLNSFFNSGIKAVFICSPNYLIKDYTIEALNRKINVFSEKPPGINLGQTLEMHLQSINNPDIILMFGFNHRHHGSVKKMKDIIENNQMGKILWIRGRYGKEVDENFLNGWRVDHKLSGGGIMLDQGIHMLDLFLYLSGDFDEVKSFVSNLYWKIPNIEDNVFVILRNSQSGICASLHSTMTQWRYIFSLEIFLEDGSLILNGLKTSSGAYGDEILSIKYNNKMVKDGSFTNEEEIIYHDDHSWDMEINHFFDCIDLNKKPSFGNSEDAIKLMEVMQKIYNN